MRVDVPGTDVVGPDGASLLDDLAALSTALTAGDSAAIRTVVDSLRTRLDVIGSTQATTGAVYNRAEAAAQQARDATVSLTGSLSEIENTDLPRALVELQSQEIAYQAALAATARVMQPSLLDFMR